MAFAAFAATVHADQYWTVAPLTHKINLVYPGGKPAADATIIVELTDPRTYNAKTYTYKPDRYGVFTVTFSPEVYQTREISAYIVSPTGCGFWQCNPDQSFDVVRLYPLTRLYLHIIDTDGVPASHVKIRIPSIYESPRNNWQNDSALPLWTTETDSYGYAMVSKLPQGFNTSLSILDDRYLDPENLRIHLARAAVTREVTIHLTKASIIKGTVYYMGTHKPIVGIHVLAIYPLVTTDRMGRFSIGKLKPGTYAVQAIRDSAEFLNWVSRPCTASVGRNSIISGINIAMIPGCIIKGKITDKRTGAAVPDCEVYAMPSNGSTGDDRSDVSTSGPDGRFTIHILPTNPTGPSIVNVSTEPEMEASNQTAHRVEVAPGHPVTLNCQIDPTLIPKFMHGIVLDQKKRPISQPTAVIVTGPSGLYLKVETDSQGRFTTDPCLIHSGNKILARSGNLCTSTPYICNGAEEVTLHLTTNALSSIHGRVLDSRGHPAAHVTVSLMPDCELSVAEEATRSNGRGYYTFTKILGNITYRLQTKRIGYATTLSAEFTPKSRSVMNIPLNIDIPDSFVSGRVVDEKGRPVANVDISDNEVPGLHTRTNRNGYFTLKPVPLDGSLITADSKSGTILQGVRGGERNIIIKPYADSP